MQKIASPADRTPDASKVKMRPAVSSARTSFSIQREWRAQYYRHLHEGMIMGSDLNRHHRDTLQKILSHPASGNIEWRRVLALLEAVGTVDEERNGKFKVTVGPETEVFERPQGKDIDVQMVVDLRRMLGSAGLAAAGAPAIEDERSRDHGDSRWGSPT